MEDILKYSDPVLLINVLSAFHVSMKEHSISVLRQEKKKA